MKPKALIPECSILVQDNDKPVHVKTKKMWRNELQDENAKKTLICTVESKLIATNQSLIFCSARMLFHKQAIRPAESYLLGSVSHFSLANTFIMRIPLGLVGNHHHFIKLSRQSFKRSKTIDYSCSVSIKTEKHCLVASPDF